MLCYKAETRTSNARQRRGDEVTRISSQEMLRVVVLLFIVLVVRVTKEDEDEDEWISMRE